MGSLSKVMFIVIDSKAILFPGLRIRRFSLVHEETRMSFTFGKIFQPFVEQRPIAVMARGVLENLFKRQTAMGRPSRESVLRLR